MKNKIKNGFTPLFPLAKRCFNKGRAGFTFIELIIALTIFSIIALGIYSTFSTGLIAARRGEGVGRLEQEARFSLDKMAKELRNAVTYNYGPDYPQAKLFSGEKNKISFLSLIYNSSIQQSEIKRITYFLGLSPYGTVYKTQIGTRGKMPSEIMAHYQKKEAQLNSLQRREETLGQSLSSAPELEVASEALSNSVKYDGLLFSYAFASDKTSASIIWQDSWKDNSKLPKGIKITLILQNPKSSSQELIFTKTVFLPQGELGQE